jgi:tetratricopeptide (TPR) repeat protein
VKLLFALLPIAAPILGGPVQAPAPGSQGIVKNTPPAVVLKAPECAALPKFSGQTGNLWESAKHPGLTTHCNDVWEGVSKFREARYLDAIDWAKRADDAAPGTAGGWVVRGSAYARWGKPAEAAEAFEKAKSIHARALDDAETLDDYGGVLVKLGRFDDARKIYRALLPRVSGTQGLCGALSVCDAAGRAYLAAGVLAMDEGPKGLDEAVAILREARARAELGGDVRRVATLMLALALDRRGDVDQGKELAAEAAKLGIPSDAPADVSVRLSSPAEITAARALGYESSDPSSALAAWKAYLANGGDKRPFADHAKKHISSLEKGDKPKAKK